jgi:hypothetical protein
VGRGAGLVLGIIIGWAATVALNISGARLAAYRAVRFENELTKTLPWLLLLVATAVVLGLMLGAKSAFGAGALVGVGLLMTAAAGAVQLLPLTTVVDLLKLFELPGERSAGYILWDGSLLFVGIVLLILGLRRWNTTSAPQYPSGPYPQANPNPMPPVFGGPPRR